MDVTLLLYLSILFGTALFIALLFRAIRFPSIIGFVLAGITLGPSGLKLFDETWVPYFIDWGAVFLFFIVGLELSHTLHLKSMWTSLKSGGAQIVLSLIAFVVLCGLLINVDSKLEILTLGFIMSLSSTAVVLRYLQDRAELETPYGIMTTSTLILQDIATIGFLIFVSFSIFIPGSQEGWNGKLLGLGLGLVAILVLIPSRNLMPYIVTFVANRGGLDLLTLFALFCAIIGAFVANYLGWSAGLGACLVGLLLGQSDEKHQLVAEVRPFQDVIYALFFISMGMIFPLEWVISHYILVVVMTLGILGIRFVLNYSALKLAGITPRLAILVSMQLLPLSEFSFIICREFSKGEYISPDVFNGVTTFTVITMIMGSILLLYIEPINQKLIQLFTNKNQEPQPEQTNQSKLIGPHVVIIGFGLTGQNLAKVLKSTGIPFVVIEMNKELANKAKEMEPTKLIIGDATQQIILNQAELETAQAVVVAVNDPVACRKIVGQIASRLPHLYILVRTRFVREIDLLKRLGAKQVIPEDFETSIEVIAHILKRCGVPDNIVEAETIAIRIDGYAMLRGKASSRVGVEEMIRILERTTTQTYYLASNSFAVGKTLAQIDLRRRTGCSIIAVVRAGVPTPGPAGDFVLSANDVLVLVGAHAQIESARNLLGKEKLEENE